MSVTQQGVPWRVCAGVDSAKGDHAIAIADPDGQVLDRFAVTFRWGANQELRDAACDFANNSRHANPWAAGLYAKARNRGHDHPHPRPAWIHIIWRAWQDPTKHGALQNAAQHHQRNGGLTDAGLTQGYSWDVVPG